MPHTPRRSHRRLLSALSFVVALALASCSDSLPIAPLRTVDGVWRGAGWGLESSNEGATLHRACGEAYPVARRLVWDHTLRARGTTSSHEFELEALPDGRIVLRVEGVYAYVDTLERAPQAAFGGEIICE